MVRETTTDGSGVYRAPALQPGVYEVSARLSGFSARPVANMRVQVGQTVAVDIRMQPAGVTETVSVVAENPVIDVRRTDVSSIVDETAIDNLPINGRRWDTFVMLTPGVTNDGNFGLISYRGISGLYNNNMVDGVDNNQAFFSEARGRTRAVYSISPASIKEFQVGVSNMSAEFGRAAGGTVNAVTKSGTNALSGEASTSSATRRSRRAIRSSPRSSGTRSTRIASSSAPRWADRTSATASFSSAATISRCAISRPTSTRPPRASTTPARPQRPTATRPARSSDRSRKRRCRARRTTRCRWRRSIGV